MGDVASRHRIGGCGTRGVRCSMRALVPFVLLVALLSGYGAVYRRSTQAAREVHLAALRSNEGYCSRSDDA